jgi:hypothetical protein
MLRISFENNSAFASNQKTLLSVDFTSNCPKRRSGNPCSYCYVEYNRNIKFNPKTVYDYRAYNGELKNTKKFNDRNIKKLNDMGGIRLFSFGDYMPEHDNDITNFLNDAYEIGLYVKAITKVPEFIYKYHDYPALKVINISTDLVGHGVDHNLARELKSKYPKVLIRVAIMKDEELENDFINECDVITFNHKHLKKLGYRKFKKDEIEKYQAEHKNVGVCCITGKCESCDVKCGYSKLAS